MAPEIHRRQQYNEKVDIWSTGVITFMLISGRNPFPGKSKKDVKQQILFKNIDLNKPYFSNASKNVKDFILKALNRNIDARWSAEQLLQHPWIVEMSKLNEVPIEESVQKDILYNLQQFAKASKFQKMIVSILIGLKTDKNDLSQLKKAFLQMDTDNDGNLTLDEILEAEKQVSGLKLGNKWKEVLYQCDLDGNGKIDFQEFLTAAINH